MAELIFETECRFELHNYTGDLIATTNTAIATMKVAQISRPGGEFEIVEREIPKPANGQVRIKIQACGICHSDAATKDGMFPWIQYPRIPGHEVVGPIDELGTQSPTGI